MTSTTNHPTIIQKETIHAPINLVWAAWTISERVTEWFAPEAIVEAKEGGAFELYFLPGNSESMNTKGCKITKLIHEKELQFSWKGPDQFKSFMNNENELTSVTIKFNSVDENLTEVVIEHSGFKNCEEWLEAYKWHEIAWSQVLNSLKSALEKGEGKLCCQP